MRLHNILLVLGIIGLVIVVALNLNQLSTFIKLLGELRWYILFLIVAIQIASYYLNGLYYKSILKTFGYDVGIQRLFEGALASNFVNYIIPTAGFAGAGFLSQVLRPQVPRGKGFLTQIMRYTLSALAVLIMMPLGILIIILTSHQSSNVNRIAIIASLIIIILGAFTLVLVNQETIPKKIADRLSRKAEHKFKKIKHQHINKFVEDFYSGYHSMRLNKRGLIEPFCWSIVYIIVEISTLYLAFLAFGKIINPGIVIMGYILANIASIFGGVFFSTGIFELGMIGTFLALGIPFALALSVTIVYRILNMLIGLPPGFYYYRKYLRKT